MSWYLFVVPAMLGLLHALIMCVTAMHWTAEDRQRVRNGFHREMIGRSNRLMWHMYRPVERERNSPYAALLMIGNVSALVLFFGIGLLLGVASVFSKDQGWIPVIVWFGCGIGAWCLTRFAWRFRSNRYFDLDP